MERTKGYLHNVVIASLRGSVKCTSLYCIANLVHRLLSRKFEKQRKLHKIIPLLQQWAGN